MCLFIAKLHLYSDCTTCLFLPPPSTGTYLLLSPFFVAFELVFTLPLYSIPSSSLSLIFGSNFSFGSVDSYYRETVSSFFPITRVSPSIRVMHTDKTRL